MARAGPARATPSPELQLRTLTLKFLPEARPFDPVKPEASITIAIANDNNEQKCKKIKKNQFTRRSRSTQNEAPEFRI
jgi:hypothetical protein